MTLIQKTIVFLSNFSLGLFVPVLSLFLLSHGCDLQSLAIVIGIYSATVIFAEVPSGMFADVRGRRNAYYLSCALTVAGFIIMYFARGIPLLIPGIILFGMGRAFASGSLDSLIIEDCLRRNGDAELSKATGSNLVYQCAGIAAGALAGGFIPNTNGYLLHVIARLAVLLAVCILCAAFLREAPSDRKTLREQVSVTVAQLNKQRALLIVLLCIFGGGAALFVLETYWQPLLTTFIPARQQYLLGIVCAGGYGANMLGSFIAGRVKMERPKSRWRYYLLFIASIGVALALLAIQTAAVGFIACYLLIYIVLGFANVPEQTLLNSLAGNEMRASLLSVASLSMQMAGVVSSALCALLVLPIGMQGVMLAMGGFSMAVVAAAAILLKLRSKAGQTD